MYLELDFSQLPEKERKFMRKQEVEKKLNEMLEYGAKCGYLVIENCRFIVPYQIGRDIMEASHGQLEIEFRGWENWKEWKDMKDWKKWKKTKVRYRWCLPGYEMPTD